MSNKETRLEALISTQVDVLVNCAGSGSWKHIEETSPDELKANMDCPYMAAAALTSIIVGNPVRTESTPRLRRGWFVGWPPRTS